MKTNPPPLTRRRVLATVLVGALLALPLAACSSSSQGSETAAGATLQWANDASWHKDGQAALAAGAKSAVGVDIDSVFFPTSEAFQAQVRSSITTPDAFPITDWWSGYRMEDLAGQGLLTDISAQWDKAVADGEYPESLKPMVSWDGVVYGVPKLVNYWVVFYNKKVFEENGLAKPTSFDELMTLCEKLKAKGITPFGLDIQDASWQSFIWFEEVLLRTDPELYQGVLDGTVAYDDPRVVDAVKVWQDVLKKGYITPTGLLTADNTVGKFASGEYAMYLIGDWWSSSLDAESLVAGTDYDAFVFPGITQQGDGAIISEVRPTVFPKAAKGNASATKFAEYFLSTDGATEWAQAAHINSPNLKVSEDTRPVHLKDLANAVADGKYQLYQRYWEGTPTPVVDAVYPLLGKIIEHPDDAASILTECQKAAQAAWPK